MLVIPIKTRTFLPPQDDIFPTLEKIGARLREGDVLVVTSKIVAIGEGRCVRATTTEAKRKLIERESDFRSFNQIKDSMFSIKGNTIIASAGIDDSNGNGYSILWPRNPMWSAKKIWDFLRKEKGLKNLGVIISDSYCTPLRAGVTGISIGFYGFHPVANHIGEKDIFGRKFTFSKSNVADGITASAVTVMGETNEQIPIAIVRGIPNLVFTTRDTRKELLIDPKKDIYYPMLKPFYAEKRR
ncbi:MAG: coenzyme F420-0:L-glutamate ligase [bacterium]|nr:coenzyme F420-0:L-glutamate ligase [bacterium]